MNENGQPTATAVTPVELLRVVKGEPSPEELAALTAVLLARGAAPGAGTDDLARRHQAVARWRRPDRTPAFDGPRTWHSAA